jgi:urease accessory protein
MIQHRVKSAPALFGALVAITGWMAAGPALAHTGTGLPGGFVSGFLHPLSGFDHLLGRPLIIALPVIFPTVMAVGGALGMANVPLPRVEIGIAISVLVMGGVIACAFRAPVWLACLIVGVFAIFHGYAHGKELPSAADPIGYSVGFVLATGLLHVAGIGIGLLNNRPGGVIATRGMGALIAVTGVFFLYQALRV